MISTASSISASVTVRGGARRSAVAVTALVTSPLPAAPVDGLGVDAGSQLGASSRPAPRTPATPGQRDELARPDSRAALGGERRCVDAAHLVDHGVDDRRGDRRAAVGAAVVAGLEHAATSRLAHIAPTGKPLPIAFAIVTTSGTTPACWKPNQARCGRSRSALRRSSAAAPALVAQRGGRRGGTAGGPAARRPRPAPGSSSTAATDGSMAASSASRSLNATWRNPSGIGKNGSCLAGWPVAASEASVRPWKLP
jgi:hypothetical protein